MVYTENKNVRLDAVTIPNGYACYVSGEGELVYCVDTDDTHEFLAIENHSAFWCRPFWGKSLSELPQRVQAL